MKNYKSVNMDMIEENTIKFILCDFCDNFLPDRNIIINTNREIRLISLMK